MGTLDSELPRLRTLIADNPPQLERPAALEHSGRSKLSELKQTIELRRSGRPDSRWRSSRPIAGSTYG